MKPRARRTVAATATRAPAGSGASGGRRAARPRRTRRVSARRLGRRATRAARSPAPARWRDGPRDPSRARAGRRRRSVRGSVGSSATALGTSACRWANASVVGVSPAIRPAAGEQLEGDDAQRVAVARRGRGLAARLLGREIPRRSEDGPRSGQRVVAGRRGDPEVGHVHVVVAVEQEVRRLDVAMNDAARVCPVERVGRLRRASSAPARARRGRGGVDRGRSHPRGTP